MKESVVIERQIKAFENFVQQLNRVAARYVSEFPELVQQIKEYRELLSKGSGVVQTEIIDDDIDDPAREQMVKRVWRNLASKLHPDRGGDALLFNYARMLYAARDLDSLNNLYDNLQSGHLDMHLAFLFRKLDSLYELQKASWKFKIVLYDRAKDKKSAMAYTQQYLSNILSQLRTRCVVNTCVKETL